MEKLKMHSPNFTDENIAKLAELFPGCVTESQNDAGELSKAIDFDLLKQELSKNIVDGPKERYQLNWPGKKEALLTANAPITKTLRPCREESVDFDNTENLFIEGDNLEALKLLQETYLGRVKMIYIDPPYNTGKDFIYADNFAESTDEYLQESGQVDAEGNRLVANTDSNGRFHSDWLSMMYPRLKLAKNLLSDDGVLFMSIDDNEVDNLKKVCSEIFGSDNFIGCAGRIAKKSNNKGNFWAPNFDYLLTFAKNIEYTRPFLGGVNTNSYNLIEENGRRKGEKYQLVRLYMSSLEARNPKQRYWIECPDGQMVMPPGTTFPPERPNLGDGIWRWTQKKFEAERDKIVIKRVKSSNLVSKDGSPARWNVFTKTYLNDVIENSTAKPNSFIEGHINQGGSHSLRGLGIPFDFSKPPSLIEYLMEVSKVDVNDIVLDFFAGSATSAHAVMTRNVKDGAKRRFIMIQIAENCDEKHPAAKQGYKKVSDVSKERIRRAGKKIKEENPNANDLDIGFRVLKVDSSNMNEVHYTPDTVSKSDLFNQIEHIKNDRNGEDLLFQVMLDWGVDLSLPIRAESIADKTVYFVNDDDLVACFEKDIDEALIKALADYEPLRVVFRDDGFESDSVKINAEQIFKQLSPNTDIKSI